MKTIWQYIAIAALAVSAAACTPQYPVPSASGLPQASNLDVVINVNQETNYVTFTMNNKGVVPVWIFGDQKIDGKASKRFAYTENELYLRFRDAGQYTVEVKAYNANGLTQGSLVKTFTLNNTYRDPFDPTPYIRAVSGSGSQGWVWNSTENGHFGCGPVGNPLGWWNGEAHCKDNAHMYDDAITFTADGKYTLDPVDGFSYMNKDVTFLDDRKGDSPYGDDFLYTNEKTTWSFTLDEENDLDVIKLADGGLFSYIPNNAFEDEPWLYVKSCTADQLVLMTYTATGNNGGSIAWQYVFKRVK